ncbi:MAG: hypothetical protein ACRCV9_16180 [Burkholderiaceae bacterium]
MKSVLVGSLVALAILAPAFADDADSKTYRPFGADNTPGWGMMSREERAAHHKKMHGMKSKDECKAYHDQHMKEMQSRMQSRGGKMNMPNMDPCEMMEKRGHFKSK